MIAGARYSTLPITLVSLTVATSLLTIHPHQSASTRILLPSPMSTVSRICFRCRIQLLKNRPALPSTPRITARTLAWSRLYPRDSTAPNLKAYSTKAKGADSPADSHSSSARRSKPDAGAHQKAEAVLEDPVAVRLEALARKLRPTKATPVDVDLFLASKRNKKVEAFTPTEADAQIVDESYGDLLSFMEAKKRPPRKNTSRFPPIEELQEKCELPRLIGACGLILTWVP